MHTIHNNYLCYYSSMNISFTGKPDNYAIIDKYVSRSAQPAKEDFVWLKKARSD